MSVILFYFSEFRKNKGFMTLFYFASFFFSKGGSVEALDFISQEQSIQDYLPQEAKKPLS